MTPDVDVTWPMVVNQLKAEAQSNELMIETFHRLRHPASTFLEAVVSAWQEAIGDVDGDHEEDDARVDVRD
jgi:hypothetical protein